MSIMLLLTLYGGCFGQQGPCTAENCRLPSCFCAGRRGPVQIQTKDIPQIVVFTFDDAMNSENVPFYQRLFRGGRVNPNGCPIAATFFVSHDWTNYDNVREMYIDGHEIGSHSVTHRMPQSWWKEASYAELKEELAGQRQNIVHHAKIPKSEIRGIRVPFLEVGGDTQFTLMRNEGFAYDSSFMAGPYSESDWRLPVWPYTLDFSPGLEYCDNNNCPKANFSGIWEFPLNRWIGLDGQACPMLDACTTHTLDTKEQALKYLRKNFAKHHDQQKAPFGIHLHSRWFSDEHKLDAMDEFITELLRMEDVYVVTMYQAVEWMRHPTPLRDLPGFAPWRTNCGTRRRLVNFRTQPRNPRPEPKQESYPTNAVVRSSEEKENIQPEITRNEIRNDVSDFQSDSGVRFTQDRNDDSEIRESPPDNTDERKNVHKMNNQGQEPNLQRNNQNFLLKGAEEPAHHPEETNERPTVRTPGQRKPFLISKEGRPSGLSREKHTVNLGPRRSVAVSYQAHGMRFFWITFNLGATVGTICILRLIFI